MARGIRALLAILAILAAAAFASAQEGVDVESIEFDGNVRYSTENLKFSMRTREGKRFDRDLLARDLAMLRAYFEEISYTEEVGPKGVRLVFRVVENPLVSRVEFVGNYEFLETDLRPLVETRTGYPLAAYKLENDVRVLQRKYRDAGYHFIEVRPEILEDEGARRVLFRIEEGPAVEVYDVIFTGNDSLPPGKLKAVMALRPAKLFGSTPFVERRLEEDRIALTKLYRDEGYLDAQVWVDGFEFDESRELATLRIVIDEGGAWTLGEVQVTGGKDLSDREKVAAEAARLVPGQRWLQKDVSRAVREMEAEAKRQGFTDARVDVVPIPREEGRVQDLRLAIREGRRFTVRFLDVAGNVVTQDRVILREFTIAPGDPLDSNAIAKSLRRVTDTQYFTSAIHHFREVKGDPGRKDVEIQVEENPRTSQFRIGGGISSDTGLFGMLSVSFHNFDIADWPPPGSFFSEFGEGRALKGAGQTLAIVLQPGSDISRYELNFREPAFLDRPVAAGFEVYAIENSLFAYDEDRTGGAVSLERKWLVSREDLDDVYLFGVTPRIESLVISNIDEQDAPPNIYFIEGRNTIHELQFDFTWRRIDQEHATERGWKVRLTSEYDGQALGGDFDFWKNSCEAVRVFTLFRDADERAHTIKLRAGGGTAMTLNEDKVPLVERFLAGGSSSLGAVRGYTYGGLGPHGKGNPNTDPAGVRESIENNDGEPMGGDALAVGSIEYQFPLVGDVLRGAAFVDAGNLQFNTGALMHDWRVSTGFGILIKVPFFGDVPLRFDFGFPIRTVDGDDERVLSFDISKYF